MDNKPASFIEDEKLTFLIYSHCDVSKYFKHNLKIEDIKETKIKRSINCIVIKKENIRIVIRKDVIRDILRIEEELNNQITEFTKEEIFKFNDLPF